MRYYNGAHQFYCGIDLHARSMHVCVVDHAGQLDWLLRLCLSLSVASEGRHSVKAWQRLLARSGRHAFRPERGRLSAN